MINIANNEKQGGQCGGKPRTRRRVKLLEKSRRRLLGAELSPRKERGEDEGTQPNTFGFEGWAFRHRSGV